MGAGLLQGDGIRGTDRQRCMGSLCDSDSLSGDGSARIPLRRPCFTNPSPQRMEEQGHPSVSVGLPSTQMDVRLGRCEPAFTRLDPVHQHREVIIPHSEDLLLGVIPCGNVPGYELFSDSKWLKGGRFLSLSTD